MDESEFLFAVEKGDCERILSLLQSNPALPYEAVNEDGNNALHLSVIHNRPNVATLLLKNTLKTDDDFVRRKNNDGKTASDLASELNRKPISWALIQSGRSEISQANLFQSIRLIERKCLVPDNVIL